MRLRTTETCRVKASYRMINVLKICCNYHLRNYIWTSNSYACLAMSGVLLCSLP